MGIGRWRVGAVTAVVAILAMSGCTSNSGSSTPAAAGGSGVDVTTSSAGSSAPTTSAAPPAAAPADLVVTPAAEAKNVDPAAPVRVAVTAGTLTDVSVTNGDGGKVTGTVSTNKAVWQASEDLGYGKTYTVVASAINADGVTAKKTSSFTTVQPDNQTMPYFNTTGGSSIVSNAVYGVGMVVSVHFDEAISNKKAAEQALIVKTSPAVAGSWYWLDDQNVHWRPQAYYRPGTKVTVTAKVYGVEVGDGLYGQADKSISFSIGKSHIAIADDNTKLVDVYDSGKLIRVMPTSMGEGGSKTIAGKTITFWTQAGTMTVLDKANPVLMDSETYGLPHASGGYKELVYWSTRITTDGVYLHSAPWSVWAQGNTDTSHGCLNLSPANAQWFYEWSAVGDVVQVKNTGGSPLQVWQNGDWGLSWANWLKGSALHT